MIKANMQKRQAGERVVCEYKGRTMTEGRAPNGCPMIHFFEGDREYGLILDGSESAVLAVLKAEIDLRTKHE